MVEHDEEDQRQGCSDESVGAVGEEGTDTVLDQVSEVPGVVEQTGDRAAELHTGNLAEVQWNHGEHDTHSDTCKHMYITNNFTCNNCYFTVGRL